MFIANLLNPFSSLFCDRTIDLQLLVLSIVKSTITERLFRKKNRLNKRDT